MNRHLFVGIAVRGIFAAVIAWVAMSDAFGEGGMAPLASGDFGLAAGACIGGLIAANFAMLALEKSEHHEKIVAQNEARATA